MHIGCGRYHRRDEAARQLSRRYLFTAPSNAVLTRHLAGVGLTPVFDRGDLNERQAASFHQIVQAVADRFAQLLDRSRAFCVRRFGPFGHIPES